MSTLPGTAEAKPASSSAPSRPSVCLAGMPNAGKTTLMNALTGGHFHTANYPGITVSLLRGRSRPELGDPIDIIDLPGVHSTVDPSPEEEISCGVIEGRDPSVRADLFVVVADATQLERHLKFAAFVAGQGRPVVLAVTMEDLLTRMDQSLDIGKLESTLGIPTVAIDARSGRGVGELLARVRAGCREGARPNALSGLSRDPVEAFRAVRELVEGSGALVTDAEPRVERDSITARLDRIALHRVFGFPLFVVALVVLFASIFWLADPFMTGIETAFAFGGEVVSSAFPDSLMARFVAEGLIGGVGAVVVFLPQIIILFFLMTLLEDSGYLARGAALVDRPLSWLGLHGRSFVPMLSGFACAIPAVFAARSIPTRRERLLTIWIIPLMSCSARLPVYALLLAALIPQGGLVAGLSLAAIYLASLLVGSVTAGLVARFAFPREGPSLLAMELPVYRVPRWPIILRTTWARSATYLRKAGGPILVIAIVLWLLSNFGPGGLQPEFSGSASPPLVAESAMDTSYAASLGRGIEPVLEPMGVDWRVGVGLISAFAAREVFVSAMAIVFHIDAEDEDAQAAGLLDQMRTATFAGTDQPVFTTASMVGLIVFFFFSLQCISTVAVVLRETNSWRFAMLQLAFYTGVGYLAAVGAVQGLRLAGVA